MDRPSEDTADGLHELISRSLRHRQALWAVLLATYRVELTRLLDHAAKSGFGLGDKAYLVDLASRIVEVASAADLPSVRSDAVSLRNFATTESSGEVGERRVLLSGLRLIDRILDTERARQTAAQPRSPALPN